MNRALEPRWLARRRRRRRRRARRRAAAARVGAPARGRRGDLHRRHPRARRHAALRARPVAGGARPARRRSTLDAIARACPAWSPCSPPPTSPAPTTAARSSTTTRSCADGEVRYLGQPVFAVIAETRDAARRAAAQAKEALDDRAAAAGADAAARRTPRGQYVLPPMHLTRGDAARPRSPRRRTGSPARSTSAARSSSTSKARSRYAIPQEDDGMQVLLLDAASERDAAPGRACAAACTSHEVQVECRRMGGGFGGKESQSALFACVAAVAAQQAAAPGQAARSTATTTSWSPAGATASSTTTRSATTTTAASSAPRSTMVSRAGHLGRPVGPGDDARALPLRQRLLAARRRHPRLLAARPTRRATPRSAASAGRRARSRSRTSSTSIARKLGTRSARRAPRQLLRHGRAQRHALRPGRSSDNVIHELVAELEASSDYRARRAAIAAFNADEPGAEARPRADAGEVRHLVQRHAPQPGRRAGARLHRRLDPGEPRRHRDGPGPEHQGGAGGGARARRRLRARARHRHRHAARSPTPRPPRPRPAPT